MTVKTRINPSAQRINAVYEDAISEILDYLVIELANPVMDFGKQQEVLSRVDKIIQTLKMQMEHEVRTEVTAIYTEVSKQLYKQMEAEGIKPATAFSPLGTTEYLLDEAKINQLIADTMTDLAAATDNTEMYIKQIIRGVFSEGMGMKAIQNFGQEQVIAELTSKLAEKGLSKTTLTEGFIGLVDKAGKKWNLKDYVDVVVKTKLMDADNEANRSAGAINNYDLAVISSHGATDDCSKWEGCIISMNGMTEGYITYEEVKATNECFHPRCQHHLQPVRDVSLVHDRILKEHNKKIKENRETVRNLNK